MQMQLDNLDRDWIAGISGRDFLAKVQRARDALHALADADRRRGACLAETDPIEFAAAFFAALTTETPVILANPKWGAQEWAELNALVLPAQVFGTLGVTPLSGLSQSDDRPQAELPPGAILIPTGGTTGGVKLAVHDWASLRAAVDGLQDFLGGGPIHSACQLPLYHVSGLMQLVRAALTGGRIHFDDTVEPGDCLSLVPTQLQRALGDPAQIEGLRAARVIFVGGAAMSAELAESARQQRLPVMSVYGMTETAAMCAAVPVEDFLNDPKAGAVPIGETYFSIEADGRIRIQSPALFKGYQGRPPIDRAQGYVTGDLGRLDPDGRLHVLGRADRLINTGGEKVDPAEVETALLRIEGITAAKVHGEPDPEWGQRVVAQIVARPSLDDAAIQATLAVTLSPYKIPKRIDRVEQLAGAKPL